MWCVFQMRTWSSQGPTKQQEAVSTEESTVYSQAIHYANRMVCMRVPLDATKSNKNTATLFEGESMSSNITNRSGQSM